MILLVDFICDVSNSSKSEKYVQYIRNLKNHHNLFNVFFNKLSDFNEKDCFNRKKLIKV